MGPCEITNVCVNGIYDILLIGMYNRKGMGAGSSRNKEEYKYM